MNFTALYNLLDFPAGVVPITKVNESDIKKLQNYQGHYGDQWDKEIKEVKYVVQCKDNCLNVLPQFFSLWTREIPFLYLYDIVS